MNDGIGRRIGVTCFVVTVAAGLLLVGAMSCNTGAVRVVGPGVSGNEPPTLTILEPNSDLTRGRGDSFVIRWTDSDRDSNATIVFSLVNTDTNDTTQLNAPIEENDLTGPDSFTAGTSLVSFGTYNLLGTIDDGVNVPVTTFAMSATGNVSQRVVITIVEPGTGPSTNPPVVAVVEPAFNLSVAQDDTLTIVIQPTEAAPDPANPIPFDPDSSVTLFVLLDVDRDPNNDDPANPDPSKIILLAQQVIPQSVSSLAPLSIPIDLSVIPPRPDGEPYFIRATVDDATNPRVHQYAVGTINVVELASGLTDLFDIGRSKSGTRFYGFSPGAQLGSSISRIGDFDADGVEDFVLVAQFGNPRNFGLLGEAYLVYGQDRLRFGGSLAVNSISETISGVIFEAPPLRTRQIAGSDAHTDGISDVSFVPDLSGDGRPEILFGLQHVHGALEPMDFDPGDSDLTSTDATVQVEVVLRQGEARFTLDDGDPTINVSYRGSDDVVLRSASPNTSTGSDSGLTWLDNGPGQREWTLIKFRDVLAEIPDSADNINITSINASLEIRVFDPGGDATLFQALTDFSEQTTFSTFAVNGGEPQVDVDYDGGGMQGGGLGTISGTTVEVVTVDVSGLVRQLIDGLLAGSRDELRFILVPTAGADGTDATRIRSSEWTNDLDRPTLRIQYGRRSSLGDRDCYPDDLINNRTDQLDEQNENDSYFYAGGMVVAVNSQNRDNRDNFFVNPARLESTVVTLELVGVEPFPPLGPDGVDQTGGAIFSRADNVAADNRGNEQDSPFRISGWRAVAGGFDFIDARLLRQPPREGLFGQKVASMGDLNNDGLSEIIISSPRNERYLKDLFDSFGFQSTQLQSTTFDGSIVVIPGTNYNDPFWREKNNDDGNSIIPFLDQHRSPPFGQCTSPIERRSLFIPADSFNIFAEDVDDMLGGADSAGDFNQDGLDDIVCGAFRNDRSSSLPDSGAVYVLYGRNILGDFSLKNADDPLLRPPMLRIRGVKPGDQIGWRQTSGLDVDGDRVDDVFIASPATDFGGVTRFACAGDFNFDGVVSSADLAASSFNSCRGTFENDVLSETEDLFSDDPCKAFDYNNDGKIDGEDESVFVCLAAGGTDCCDNLVDNGFVAIVFGGVFVDGDRDITQIATNDLPGVVFFGSGAGHRAGLDVSSAGDFNQDGFGDILIAVPGETRLDITGRERLGVVYLVFGGTHLKNTTWSLAHVGSADLPGIVFLSPYVKGRPNEAAPTTVAFLGDVNNDGFGDIAIGNPLADFIDLSFPQGPEATDASVGRRRNAGDVYVVYGNNFGSNRGSP